MIYFKIPVLGLKYKVRIKFEVEYVHCIRLLIKTNRVFQNLKPDY